VYRVRINVNILAPERYSYYDKIVNVLQVVTNSFLRVSGTGIANNKVPSCSYSNLIRYMTG
jgi:hypothetical protein